MSQATEAASPAPPEESSRDRHARWPSAVVTGASSGIGRALAVALAARSDYVALVGRDADRLAAVSREAQSCGARAEHFVTDFELRESPVRLARELQARLPAVSVLVHAAGHFVSGPLDTTSADDFDRAMDVNLRAPYLLTRELSGALAAGRGDVVFINSSVVGQRRAGVAAYAASKQGLLALADSLRQEINPSGVRVLSVFLGATATPMQEQIYSRDGRAYQPEALLQPDDVARIVMEVIAMPRGAEVTDLHLRPACAHR
jgi:NAD(P)-dependent dehydrogenase (short-subunit alcohol dehydrogenase family)